MFSSFCNRAFESRSGSDDEGNESPATRECPWNVSQSLEIDAAPSVESHQASLNNVRHAKDYIFTSNLPGFKSLNENVPASKLFAPLEGPQNKFDIERMTLAQQNHWAGRAESAHVDASAFDSKYHTFDVRPDESNAGVDINKGHNSKDKYRDSQSSSSTKIKKEQSNKKQKKTNSKEICKMSSAPFVLDNRQPWAEKKLDGFSVTAEIEKDIPEKRGMEIHEAGIKEFSKFHGDFEIDYQGRSWIEINSSEGKEVESSVAPKKHIFTWTGHTKGVNAIRFFPRSGHLLLSAGLDGLAKIWNVNGNRKCMRTYSGHSKGLKGVTFSWDGRQFTSFAYDKMIKIWDTETGKITLRLGDEQSMAHCVTIHPEPSQKDVLLVGMQNKKIVQYDLRTHDVVQEYDYHLGPVNSITFVDSNRRFISTSDDRTIRVWEFGIPVQIKYIADATMQAISSASISHSGKWWIGQSLDNQIVTYSGDQRTRPIHKKTFSGHSSAGYACDVGFSPDDQYVVSGDGDGRCFVWDWKTTRASRVLKAHDNVCIGAQWHPLDARQIVTCGWDGAIKLWN